MNRGHARGQATVEFALIIPLVLVALLAVIQVAIIAYSQLAVTHIAREVARTVAVSPAADIGHWVDNRSLLGADGLHIVVQFAPSHSSDRELVCVDVSYEIEAISSIFGMFLDDFQVHAQAKMLVE